MNTYCLTSLTDTSNLHRIDVINHAYGTNQLLPRHSELWSFWVGYNTDAPEGLCPDPFVLRSTVLSSELSVQLLRSAAGSPEFANRPVGAGC